MMKKSPCIIIAAIFLIIATPTYARTTPEDIVNAQKASYTQSIRNYSASNKQKLETWEKKIEVFNDLKSSELEHLMETQGAILDEFTRREAMLIRRSEIAEKKMTDGKSRNLSDPIENARYWLTYAHEAVAYQAAKVYVFNPTGESAIHQNILSTINIMQGDINVLKGKVQKSQSIIEVLINKNEL